MDYVSEPSTSVYAFCCFPDWLLLRPTAHIDYWPGRPGLDETRVSTTRFVTVHRNGSEASCVVTRLLAHDPGEYQPSVSLMMAIIKDEPFW